MSHVVSACFALSHFTDLNVASMWGYHVTGTLMALKPASLNIFISSGLVTGCPHAVS